MRRCGLKIDGHGRKKKTPKEHKIICNDLTHKHVWRISHVLLAES